MSKFKEGDRVRISKEYIGNETPWIKDFINDTGVIVRINLHIQILWSNNEVYVYNEPMLIRNIYVFFIF